MSDYNSSLPIRTENSGDVIAKIADATTPSQQLAIDSSGRVVSKITASNGDPLTATGTSLNVNITGGSTSGVVQDQSLFAYGTDNELPVGGVYNDTGPTLISGTTGALRLTAQRGLHSNLRDASGAEVGTSGNPLRIDPTGTTTQPISGTVTAVQATGSNLHVVVDSGSITLTEDHDYGTVGVSTLRTAAQIGNATGAANFNAGASGAQTLRVSANITRNGTELSYDFGASDANSLRVSSLIGNATGAADFNFGAVGAQTLRAASQIGNATGAADFNAGSTGAQTLRVEANQGASASAANGWYVKPTDGSNSQSYTASGEALVKVNSALPAGSNNIGQVSIQDSSGSAFSESNPLPVFIADSTGSEINDYNTATVASSATSNHDYTVTAGKTLKLSQIEASASAKMKIEVQIETGVATGVFNTRFVKFNSTANPNMSIILKEVISVAAGVRVRIIRTNEDNQSQDLYSTISGHEIP